MPVTVILSKTISRAFEAVGGGFDVAVILSDLRAELFEPLDVQIDGAGSDGATAGKRNAGAPAAGYQRAQDQRGGAHGLDQFVGRFGAARFAQWIVVRCWARP